MITIILITLYVLWCNCYGFRLDHKNDPSYLLEMTWRRFFMAFITTSTLGLFILPMIFVCNIVDSLKDKWKRLPPSRPSRTAILISGFMAGKSGSIKRDLREAELAKREARIKELEKELEII